MELDAFIKETLVQISNGIQQANEELEPKRKSEDGTDLPKLYLLSPGRNQEQGNGVHFDVAVTSSAEDAGNGGVKVKLAVVQADLGGKIKTSETSVSRIQFSVNVNQWHG
ncbi:MULTISPECIES: hypothetical protein [Vibrio]|uniref:hypothetical protein n=1 Tax=Vibrio TaxID=662 RepID=UPI00051D5807|nr:MULTISPECIES: hypothetical protein [Vibrio]EHA1127954.1 hypothetical protein [Vibrio navarrensis]KGK09575.1 hypothetical protein EA24_02465 [Vibrio navarrensis]RZR09192.1 hypothetical protein D8T44_21080 [Vibrio vulnificus]